MATTRKNIPADHAEKILDVAGGTRLQLYVPAGANTVRVAGTREALEIPPSMTGAPAGIPVTNAGGPVELTWSGEMWAIASAAPAPLDITGP